MIVWTTVKGTNRAGFDGMGGLMISFRGARD